LKYNKFNLKDNGKNDRFEIKKLHYLGWEYNALKLPLSECLFTPLNGCLSD